MRHSEYNSLSCPCQNNSLNDLTDQEALDIVTNHFKGLPTTDMLTIGVGVTSGNFNPLANEVKKITEKICVAGSQAKFMDFVTSPIGIGIGALLVGGIGYLVLRK